MFWPESLVPNDCAFDPVPFTRTPGVTIGGVQPSYRTDRGFWKASYANVPVAHPDELRAWNRVRTSLGGRAGLVVVPVFDMRLPPFALDGAGRPVGPIAAEPHGDGTRFADGTGYRETGIRVEVAADAPVGATVVRLRDVASGGQLEGVRFSTEDFCLHETGAALDVIGDLWEIEIFPALRLPLAAGAPLEFDRPSCLMHLATDTAMDLSKNALRIGMGAVDFVEATDWFAARAMEALADA